MRLLFCALGSALLCASTAHAAVYKLQGTVYGGSIPLPSTTVQALVPGTTTVVATDTTDASGHYVLSLAAGTYDLLVNPPTTSGYGAETVRNLALSADRRYDVILIAVTPGTLYGTIRGLGNVPLPGISINVYTNAWVNVTSGLSDANGQFKFAVGTGTFHLQYSSGWPPAADAPQSWNCSRYNIAVTGATNADVSLPVIQIAGTVRGSDGPAVPNVGIRLSSNSYWGATGLSCSSSVNLTSDSTGGYLGKALGGSQSFDLTPPTGSGYGPATIGKALTADGIVDLVVPSLNNPLAGTVIGRGGKAIGGVNVSVYTTNWRSVASAQTDAAGAFSFKVALGTYRLQFDSGWPPSPAAPPGWRCSHNSLAVTGATTLNLSLPVIEITGTVRGANGVAVPNVAIQANSDSYDSASGISCNATNNTTSSATAAYSTLAFGGNQRFNLTPPANSGFGPMTQVAALVGDSVFDIALPLFDKPLTGVITGRGGAAIAGASVNVYTTNWRPVDSQRTDASGSFAFKVGTGSYHLQFNSGWPPSPVEPSGWGCSRYNFAVGTSAHIKLALPTVSLSELFTDSNGVPVPGVSVQFRTSAYDPATGTTCNANLNGSSDASGALNGLVLAGNAYFQFRPPPQSGFIPISLSSVLDQDLSQSIILVKPDIIPPRIVSAPTVIHLSSSSVSIGWVTDKASDSTVQYGTTGLTSTTSQAAFVTRHTVTLTGLTPTGTYQFRVGSVDKAHNGPTWSAVSTFTSQAPPGDITPPVLTLGPTVPFVDLTTVIVQWKTDEPASSVVRWGPAGGALSNTIPSPVGQFVLLHTVPITGLTAGTSYSVVVESTDPDGNGPTVSRTITFTTATAPDVTPPKIGGVPSVGSVTDTSITVSWTTDKASTSGASLNDGLYFHLVSDPAWVTDHSLTVSGLRPATTYHLTVSSTDPKGNGPALAGPIDVTTRATRDTTPPKFTLPPAAQPDKTRATISWSTDKASTSVVRYGPKSGALTGMVADIALVSDHSVLITGLTPATTYYVTATSVDASENTATTLEFTFTTKADKPTVACVGTSALPVVINTAPRTCGAILDPLNAGSCGNADTCMLDGKTSMTVGPGSRQVAVVATNASGSASCTSFVSVVDAEAPHLTCPAPSTVECAGSTTPARPAASCTDNCGCSAGCVAGSYALGGPYNVSCQAQDAAGNVDACTTQVTVKDTIAPALACGAKVKLECDAPDGALVTPSAAIASDVCGLASVTSYGASRYGFGATSLHFVATDVGKNSTAVDCAAAVTVVDTVPPTIFCPAARTVECSAGAGTTSGFLATGWDLCSASIVPSDKSGTYPFAPPAKTTGVTFSITDAQGLGSSCRSSVTVADTLPPNLLATPQPVWKSSDIEHQDTGNVQHSDLVTVKLSECVALAADACDGTLDADRSGKISRVERLSPDQESEGCDLGSMILSGSSVQLEPDNEGAYRIYFAVTDASGNSRASSCEVRFTDGDHGQRPPRSALTCSCCEGVGCGTCPPPTPEDHGRH